MQTYSVPRPNFPNNHAEFESLVLSYAVSSRLQGSKPWQSYAARNKVAQRTPAPSAANFGAIDGSGNPFKPSTYGPTDTHPSSTYQAEHAEQSNFMLIFTGTLHVTKALTFYQKFSFNFFRHNFSFAIQSTQIGRASCRERV